ncbi:hypothetical protein C2S52_011362 [Perilla frutescens var. hirtella]|nr:hypothetical protein C2S52_011362 [Perilla frutescens var. hirtella]
MSCSKSDEAVFVSFLRLRIGFVDLSHALGTALTLDLLAKLMSGARYRHFRTIELVHKLKELKELFYSFEKFKMLPGITYDEDSNCVTTIDAYFSLFSDIRAECEMHRDFRLNEMPEYRGIRDIIQLGGVVNTNFESLVSRFA